MKSNEIEENKNLLSHKIHHTDFNKSTKILIYALNFLTQALYPAIVFFFQYYNEKLIILIFIGCFREFTEIIFLLIIAYIGSISAVVFTLLSNNFQIIFLYFSGIILMLISQYFSLIFYELKSLYQIIILIWFLFSTLSKSNKIEIIIWAIVLLHEILILCEAILGDYIRKVMRIE